MKIPLRILIVGGYGTFGGRLVELLEDEPRVVLLVGGRSKQNAQEYCAKRPTLLHFLTGLIVHYRGTLSPRNREKHSSPGTGDGCGTQPAAA